MSRRHILLLLLLVLLAGCKAEDYPELCATNADCRPASRCVAGLCRNACKTDLECRSELRCLDGVCTPCPGGVCTGNEADADADAQDNNENNPELPQEIREPEIPSPDADADTADEVTPEPEAEAEAEGEGAEPEAKAEGEGTEPEHEAGPGPLGSCDPKLASCPAGHACVRLANRVDFPPVCQDAVEDGTFDGNCFACRPICTGAGQCAPHENCLSTTGTQDTCMTLFCDAWRDFTPAHRGAAARLTEIDADSGQQRVYTLDRVDVVYGDVTVTFSASSLCFPVGTKGADFEVSLNVFVELPEINTVSVYDLGQASGAHILARDAAWCTDRWNAIEGQVEVLMLDSGDTILRLSGVYLTREQGGCLGVDERYFDRIIIGVGPQGRQSEGANCSYPESSFCRPGQVCAPYGSGRCYPFCDAGTSVADKIGCTDNEQCIDPGTGIGLLDGGVCN